MGSKSERDRFHPETLAEWRAWLAVNHLGSKGVWLVSWKAGTGRPRLGYEESVEEALAFGWVDSQAATLDGERAMLWFTPRKANSPWSLTNKERIARLEASGRIADAGRGAVRAAKANGMWTLLDDAQNLIVPDDLAEALAATPGARERWDAFSASARRRLLEWIVLARRPATRATRIAETARRAALGDPDAPADASGSGPG
jgi:uncharacterized protein YdeI (YjbR/CyaY-like superfamily)